MRALHHISCCSAAKHETHAMQLICKEFLHQAAAGKKERVPLLLGSTPAFGHGMIVSPPYLPTHIGGGVALVGDGVMGTPQDHRKRAEQCVAMARAADDHNDKALWLTLAQSWIRLAEHVARGRQPQSVTNGGEDVRAAHSSE